MSDQIDLAIRTQPSRDCHTLSLHRHTLSYQTYIEICIRTFIAGRPMVETITPHVLTLLDQRRYIYRTMSTIAVFAPHKPLDHAATRASPCVSAERKVGGRRERLAWEPDTEIPFRANALILSWIHINTYRYTLIFIFDTKHIGVHVISPLR